MREIPESIVVIRVSGQYRMQVIGSNFDWSDPADRSFLCEVRSGSDWVNAEMNTQRRETI